MPSRGLGRVVPPDWEHVERYPLRALAALPPEPAPDTVVRHPLPVRYDQGQTPRCVDFGSCTLMSATELANEGQRVEFQPGYLYRWAERHDGLPDEGGTTVRAGMDYLRRLGLIPRRRAAGRRKITENRWCQSMTELLAVLVRQPVPIGVNWYNGMMRPDAEGFIHRNGGLEGGHFVTLSGLNMVQGYADVGQTWGPRLWAEAPDEQESWNVKIGLEDLDRITFSEDGEAVAITDRLER
jgi:hypothetical protein